MDEEQLPTQVVITGHETSLITASVCKGIPEYGTLAKFSVIPKARPRTRALWVSTVAIIVLVGYVLQYTLAISVSTYTPVGRPFAIHL
jgi:hypothetical protein